MSEWSKWTAVTEDGETDPVEHKSDYGLFEADAKVLRDPSNGWVVVIDEPDTLLAVYRSIHRDYMAALLYRKESST